MIRHHYEPTLGEILSDPATRALMRADGVKRRDLEAMLDEIAHKIARNPKPRSGCGASTMW
jgi:hypothetical protein